MLIRLFLFALLVCFSATANAEYYLVYQDASSHVINLNFTPKAKKKTPIRHATYSKRSERVDKAYACGCTPESCYVPKRDIYTAASTDCVTYDSVVAGYR